MEPKTDAEKQNRQDRLSGCALMGAAGFLLLHCFYRHAHDAVQYPWALSPYLFPALAAGVLFLLGLLLWMKSRRKDG